MEERGKELPEPWKSGEQLKDLEGNDVRLLFGKDLEVAAWIEEMEPGMRGPSFQPPTPSPVPGRFPSLLYGKDEEVTEWVSERIKEGGPSSIDPCVVSIGVQSGGKLIGGVLYYDYYPDFQTMQLGIAAINPMWAKRENIVGLLAYPFIQAGVFNAWVLIGEDNEQALKTVLHIGFRHEALLKHQFGPGKHAIMLRMLKPEYEQRYGQL